MRISLIGSAAKAAPGSKTETAMMAAMARRELWACLPLLAPLKTSLFFSKLGGKETRKYMPATGHGEDGFT
jgi:hypothetical protein